MKTLGLLTLMAQCGIPIPAEEGSQVAVVQKIFADIGDEQSLQDNLSTFSAWIRTTSRIVQEADAASLVLLDEVGGGTDPAEGAALTMALIDGLRARGAKTVVTTHLHLLKAYGAIHPDVVNVSVEINPDTLRPTYRLIYGRPGESYALLMAEKYGMPRGADRAGKKLFRGRGPKDGGTPGQPGANPAGMGKKDPGSRGAEAGSGDGSGTSPRRSFSGQRPKRKNVWKRPGTSPGR